jgi:hypothetical protein
MTPYRQAEVLAYHQIRELEEFEIEKAKIGAGAGMV